MTGGKAFDQALFAGASSAGSTWGCQEPLDKTMVGKRTWKDHSQRGSLWSPYECLYKLISSPVSGS